MLLNDKTDRRINLNMQQYSQSPTLNNINEEKTILGRIRKLELQVVEHHQYLDVEKTILERIRKLELQVVELQQYLDVEKAKVDLLRDKLGISVVHD